jgi:hypothetical protein
MAHRNSPTINPIAKATTIRIKAHLAIRGIGNDIPKR